MFGPTVWEHGTNDEELITRDDVIAMGEPTNSIGRSVSVVQSAVPDVTRPEAEEVNVDAGPAGSENRILSSIERLCEPPSPSLSSISEAEEEEVRVLLLAEESTITSPSLSEPPVTFPGTPALDGRVLSDEVSAPHFQPPTVQWPPIDLYQHGAPALSFSQAPPLDDTLRAASASIVSNLELDPVAARDSRRLQISTASDIVTPSIVDTVVDNEGVGEETPGGLDPNEPSRSAEEPGPFTEVQVEYIKNAIREAIEGHAQTFAPKRSIEEVDSATASEPGWFLRDLYFVPS